MRKCLCLLGFWSIALWPAAQPPGTARLENLRDAWDLQVTYVGQVKNGKPNGLGQFIYHNGYALRYAGYFTNGLPGGKGVLLMADGAFLWGDWQNGKLNGQGANLSGNGNLYLGSFKDGMREGRGVLLYSENNFVAGGFKNDLLNGRATFLGENGKMICENVYQDGVKEGPGYQYELNDRRLHKGTWQKGQWVRAGDVPYSSFLGDSRFTGQLTAAQALMGCVNSDKKLQDTGFVYDLTSRKRYFGAFDNGRLIRGMVIRDDTSALYGSFNEKGASGYCSFLNRGKYYDEGIFEDDYMRGTANLSIDLVKKTVYYGHTAGKSEFSGKAWFSSARYAIYQGDFLQGKFTGTGWKLDSAGYCTGGVWSDGVLHKLSFLTQPSGQPMSISPATLNESLRQSILLSQVDFLPVIGQESQDMFFADFESVYETPYKMLPGSKGDYLVSFDDNLVQIAIMEELKDANQASARYAALCKQVAAATIGTGKPGVAWKLSTTDKLVAADPAKALATFSLGPDPEKKWQNTKVMVVQVHSPDFNTYRVLLAVGSAGVVEEWLDSF